MFPRIPHAQFLFRYRGHLRVVHSIFYYFTWYCMRFDILFRIPSVIRLVLVPDTMVIL